MSGLLDLTGPAQGPHAGGAPRRLVILLHGLGADGSDLLGLAPHWAPALPDAAFLAPDAPFPCDMAPYGRQWFSFQDRRPERLLAGAEAAAQLLDAFIDRALQRHGLGPAQLALVGFSQGAMMALHVAPRRAEAVGAVVGYSGALIGAAGLAARTKSRPPVLLIHGDADEIVPPRSLPDAAEALTGAGFALESVVRPGLGHGIDPEGLALGGRFLARHLVAAPAG